MSHLNLVVIRVADLESAAAFYRLIGLEFQRHRHGNGPEHLACETEQLVFELYQATTKNPVAPSTRLGFIVDDVDVTLARMNSDSILSRPSNSEWGRRAVVSDPDGHRIELLSIQPD